MRPRGRVARRTAWPLSLALAAGTLSACTAFGQGAGCDGLALDGDLAASVLAATRTEPASPGAVAIDHLELTDLVGVPLPDDLHRYGAVRLIGVQGDVIDAAPASEEISGVRGFFVVAAGEDGSLVAPVDDAADLTLDVPAPASADAGLEDWLVEVRASPAYAEALGCVNPN